LGKGEYKHQKAHCRKTAIMIYWKVKFSQLPAHYFTHYKFTQQHATIEYLSACVCMTAIDINGSLSRMLQRSRNMGIS